MEAGTSAARRLICRFCRSGRLINIRRPRSSDQINDTLKRSSGHRLFLVFIRCGDYLKTMKSDDLITVDTEILGGTPVFKGTRVPVKALFDYLEDNYTIEEFLKCFPSVTRDTACRILERSEMALLSKS